MLLAARILAYFVDTKELMDKKKKMTVTIVTALRFVMGEPTKLSICDD
jgi:hypothetical protein